MGQPTADTERDLQERFARGDMSAFGELVSPHLDSVYTVCLRYLSSPSEAEDVLQEALVRAMDHHKRYQPGRDVRPWLMTIALNLARSRLRSTWWRRVVGMDEQHSGGDHPEHQAESADSDEKVRKALSTLPRHYREALSLYYLSDMTYAEMSEITGKGVPALKQRVRRGLPLLQNAVERLYPGLVPARTGVESES